MRLQQFGRRGSDSKNHEERSRELQLLANQVIECTMCPRLVKHRQRVAQQKKREFHNWKYWGRPVSGFGDPNAKIIIIGLAPAAHGANRTGRMFTGDSSGNFLMRTLYEAGLANMPTSERADDGLSLNGTYLTAALRCAPPENKPTRTELMNCRHFLCRELNILGNAKAVLTLGRVAFEAYRYYLRESGMNVKELAFGHGSSYEVGKGFPRIFVSYHPSRQNTQTRRLTAGMLSMVVMEMKKKIENLH